MEKTKEILKKSINQIKENKWIHYGIIILIGIILSIPLNRIQIRETHDGFLHMLRLIGTADTLKIGKFPPLVIPNYCNNSGYAMNLFYPPIVTYLPLFIKLFTLTYAMALKLFGALCIILSGITMYKFIYQVTGKKSIALFSSIFYLISPYKLANVYKRFAIGEFTAMVFIPLVFLGLYNLFRQDRKKHYYIAIGAIGLMLSHTVTTLYIAIFCIIYIIFNIKKLKEKEIIKKCIINVIFILLVTMLFWLPLLEATSMADYTIMNDRVMSTNGEYAQKNVISFSQLFKDKGEENGTTFLLGIPTTLAILLTVFVMKNVDNKYKEFYLICIIFALISFFMVSKFFPWIFMPNLICKLQYPWRMMGYFTFFVSFVCGVNLYLAIKQIAKKDIIQILFITIFVILSVTQSICILSQFFTEDETLDKKYENYILENKNISHKSVNRDYMPLKALYLQNDYIFMREDKTYVLNGTAKIITENKENLTDIIEIQNAQTDTILEFPYYYYPGYKIELVIEENIEELNSIESENGFLSCVLNKNIEEATIKVEYVGTTITCISYIVSAISLIIFIGYIIYENKKGEKNEKNKKDVK